MSQAKKNFKIEAVENIPIFIAFNGYIVQFTFSDADLALNQFDQKSVLNLGEPGTYGNPIPPRPISPPKTGIEIFYDLTASGNLTKIKLHIYYKTYLVIVNIKATGAPIMSPPRPLPSPHQINSSFKPEAPLPIIQIAYQFVDKIRNH